MMRITTVAILILVLLTTGLITQSEESSLHLPVILSTENKSEAPTSLMKGYVRSCETTHRVTLIHVQSSHAYFQIVYSDAPGGAPLGSTSHGSLTVSPDGPLEGSWWVWLEDVDGDRISDPVVVVTHGEPGLGNCQIVGMVFYYSHDFATPPPPPSAPLFFNVGVLDRCDSNAHVTYVQGTTYIDGNPESGDWSVAFSYAPDGPVVAKIRAGPHPGNEGWDAGFYSHILQLDGPREGDWWFWVVDPAGNRISPLVFVHTDGAAGDGKCQQAVIDFDRK